MPARRFSGPPSAPFHSSRALAALAAERNVVHDAGGQYSGQTAELIQQSSSKGKAGDAVAIILPGKRDLSRKNVVGRKARRHFHDAPKTEAEQSRPGHEP